MHPSSADFLYIVHAFLLLLRIKAGLVSAIFVYIINAVSVWHCAVHCKASALRVRF